MLCHDCQGLGYYTSKLGMVHWCATCQGQGITHCCEGDQAQPEVEEKVCVTTADLDRIGPTRQPPAEFYAEESKPCDGEPVNCSLVDELWGPD